VGPARPAAKEADGGSGIAMSALIIPRQASGI
jgi:hypothetical protein